MSEFDFKRAWYNVARPAFDALPEAVKALIERVDRDAAELRQDPSTLLMPWSEGLREAFESFDSDTLAVASHVVYFYGHWAFGEHTKHAFQERGTYWKFSDYADQVLAARLGLPAYDKYTTGYGITYRVHQGMLRVQSNTPDSWLWEDCALGTQTSLFKLTERSWPLTPQVYRNKPSSWRAYDQAIPAALRAAREEFWPAELAAFKTVVEDYQEKPRRKTAVDEYLEESRDVRR